MCGGSCPSSMSLIAFCMSLRAATIRLSWKSAEVRQDEIRDSEIGLVFFEFSQRVDAHTEVGQFDIHRRCDISRYQVIVRLIGTAHPPVLFFSALEEAMEKREMDRID